MNTRNTSNYSAQFSNAKPVERNTIGSDAEFGILVAMRKIWEGEKKECRTKLSFPEWLMAPKNG
jgi:hypothetical protein